MLTFDETIRFVRIQERLRNATYHELRKDGHHKSSEGAMSISLHLPAVVGDSRDPWWSVEAYSYLLCPEGRSDQWSGKSASEAISKAEDAVRKWCFSSEMEQFSGDMGEPDAEYDESNPPPDDEDGIPR